MLHRGLEVLKGEHTYVGQRLFDNLKREWCICLITVAQNQVVLAVAPDRFVSGLVVPCCEGTEFLAPRLRLP